MRCVGADCSRMCPVIGTGTGCGLSVRFVIEHRRTSASPTSTNVGRTEVAMTRMTIAHVAAIASLLVSTAAGAASYTGHYKYVGPPSQHVDDKLQADLATCDDVYGVQHATPSKSYLSCMRQHGWKFL